MGKALEAALKATKEAANRKEILPPTPPENRKVRDGLCEVLREAFEDLGSIEGLRANISETHCALYYQGRIIAEGRVAYERTKQGNSCHVIRFHLYELPSPMPTFTMACDIPADFPESLGRQIGDLLFRLKG